MNGVEALTRRVRALEDRAEIAELLASFGPTVDSLAGSNLVSMWTSGGEYRVGEEFAFRGAELAGLTELPGHQAYVAAGCGHVLSAPQIRLDGDSATAVNYSMVVLREGDRWVVERLSANAWTLERTGDGWRVRHRENRLLDGGEAATEIIGTLVRG